MYVCCTYQSGIVTLRKFVSVFCVCVTSRVCIVAVDILTEAKWPSGSLGLTVGLSGVERQTLQCLGNTSSLAMERAQDCVVIAVCANRPLKHSVPWRGQGFDLE